MIRRAFAPLFAVLLLAIPAVAQSLPGSYEFDNPKYDVEIEIGDYDFDLQGYIGLVYRDGELDVLQTMTIEMTSGPQTGRTTNWNPIN